MKAQIKSLAIAASLAFACVSAPAISSAAPSPAGAGQATSSSSASSSTSSASTHASHKKSRKRHSKGAPIQKAPTADRISEIQTALARGGYYQGDPNGKWDSNTVAAMQKFQSANGIEPTGKLDAPTLQKLGLGSPIAGVSAPRPVTPSCCSMAQPNSPPSGDKPAMTCCSASPSPQPQSAAPSGSATSTSNSAVSVSDPKSSQR
ncbi:MAG: peptidoglycan-binding domain-containing protein [Candidatus Acidiferrales bacterium]